MSGSVSAGYVPLYPVPDNLPDPEIRTFITNFYKISDRPEANELWVSQFTKDARVAIGPGKASGQE
ncbi:fungal specific transcription factor, partial [Trichoderma arundinaceum]